MDKVIRHGLEISAGLDKASQKEMRQVIRDIFVEEAHIDFNNPENVKGLRALADIMKKMFQQAGNTKFDFSKMIELPGPELFDGLKEAAMEFDSVWTNIVSKFGKQSLKDVFMRDQSDLSMALSRLTNKDGQIVQARIKNIQKAFKDVKFTDINKLLNEAMGVEEEFRLAESWEDQTAAALRYLKVYEKIKEQYNKGSFTEIDIERDLLPVYKSIDKLGDYSVSMIRDVVPQMQASLQNIFNLASGKSLIGLTEGGRVDFEVVPTVMQTLDIGDVLGGKTNIEVPVIFKAKLDLMRDLSEEGDFDQLEKLQDEIVSMFPEDVQEVVLKRLEKFAQLEKVTARSYQTIWKDFVGYGLPTGDNIGGFGVGDGSSTGDASSAELEAATAKAEALQAEINEANQRTKEAEEKAAMYDRAMMSMKEEMDDLRGRLAEVGTGTGDETGQSGGITAEEVENLENIRAKIVEITTAVEAKTNAFKTEGTEVGNVVDGEIAKLDELESKVAAVKATLEGLLNNIKTGADDVGAGLSNVTVNVNHQADIQAIVDTIGKIKGEVPYSAMSRDDATGYIVENYDHEVWDNWYSKSIDEFRTQIAVALENDTKMRNAALNQMWDEYRNLTGKDIGFDEFLNTKIPLYRGEPTDSQSQSERALSFSLTSNVAEEFGERVLRVWMRPIDTLGMANPTYVHQPEAEVMVPKEFVPEYDKWRASFADQSTGESNVADAPWAREDTLTAVKGVLEQIQANTTKTESIEIAPANTDVGNVLATEGTLVAIKSAVESINSKVVKGTKATASAPKTATKKLVTNTLRPVAYSPERKETNKMSLEKLKMELKASGRLTDELQKKFTTLARSLGNTTTGAGLAKWNEKFKQFKLELGTDNAQNKGLRKQAEELGVWQAKVEKENTQETRNHVDELQEKIKAQQTLLRLTKEERDAIVQITEETKQNALNKLNDKQADKDAKKQTANAKKMAQREAMLGKAGNAVGRAENTWMGAVGLEGELPASFVADIDEYYQKLDALRKKHQELKNSDMISEEQKNDLIAQTMSVNKMTEEIGELVAEFQKLSGDNATVIGTNTLNSGAGLGAYEQQLKQTVMTATNGKAQIKGFDAATKTLTYTVKTGKNEFTEYTAAVRRADGALVSVQGTTKRTETFFEATKRKMKELTSYMSGMAIFSRIGQELRRGIQYVREIDLALTELKKVTDETEETYDKFLDTAAKTGEKLGSTISAVTEATATFAKLGYTMEQATEMAEAAIVYKNVGDNIASTEDAADSIISTMKGFKLEATEAMKIVDRFNEVGNRFAITSQGIGEALRLSASALSEGGNSLDESIGLITAANEVVNDPSSVGKK